MKSRPDKPQESTPWISADGPRIPMTQREQTPEEREQLVIDLARELYDRFVMGGWEPKDAYSTIREMLAAKQAPLPQQVDAKMRKREILAICASFTPEAAIEFLADALIRWELREHDPLSQSGQLRDALELLLRAIGPQSLTFGPLHMAITKAKAVFELPSQQSEPQEKGK